MNFAGSRFFVTGHNAKGQAVFVADGVPPVTPLCGDRVAAKFLLARDGAATFPDDGTVPPPTTPMPLPGGFSFSTLTIAAGADDDYHAFVVNALGAMAEPDHPGFHKTPTLDLIIVLDGELILELDGEERLLRRGDSAVLNGVRHRWHNRGDRAAILAAVMMGAHVHRA